MPEIQETRLGIRKALGLKGQKKSKSQLELELFRPKEQDRNFHLGGRSFYFFDFDDNVAYLSTPIVLFHKETEKEVFVSSGEFAKENKKIGSEGVYKDYYMNFNDDHGSFRYFRDKDFGLLDKIVRKKQTFVQDIEKALSNPDYHWKAPSWECFYHATYNQRPMSVITARGHNAETMVEGIKLMVRDGHLPMMPNFLSIYPVSNPDTRIELGDRDLKSNVAELKRAAIRESVEKAIQEYGYNPHHRFGMSDDDEKNIELITEEMKYLKRKYPEMSFFVIQTFEHSYIKREILQQRTRRVKVGDETEQLNLF
ncbi:MAG: hypothetical protein EP326_14305 [Deltaproteobacteria bacterium]|nr:MAG: hypothetical protein EP326_14305 [Deltaproteobacteria bacterium]TNF31622.1 MAG: hypothetical protein EP319_01620 [Deltaproteobacteria bacterium]